MLFSNSEFGVVTYWNWTVPSWLWRRQLNVFLTNNASDRESRICRHATMQRAMKLAFVRQTTTNNKNSPPQVRQNMELRVLTCVLEGTCVPLISSVKNYVLFTISSSAKDTTSPLVSIVSSVNAGFWSILFWSLPWRSVCAAAYAVQLDLLQNSYFVDMKDN